jgi:RecA-family ATPase
MNTPKFTQPNGHNQARPQSAEAFVKNLGQTAKKPVNVDIEQEDVGDRVEIPEGTDEPKPRYSRENPIADKVRADFKKRTQSPSADEPQPIEEQVKNDSHNEITAADLLRRKVESIPCLIEPIFQRVGLASVAGSSDVGKSAFLRQLAFEVGTGQSSFLGWPIRAKHRSAIYVSTEDDENATAFLLNSLNKQQRQDPSHCAGLRFVFETHDLINELNRRLTQAPADLVVIDAFGDLYTGDANKTNQIRQFLHDFGQLAQKYECLFLWLHHTGKRTDDEAPSKHHVIGGQGFEGKMRLLIELRRDHHDDSLRHLCIVKGNYLPDEYKGDSYVLSFENFQFGQTGERVPFEQLAKPKPVEEGEGDAEIYAKIIALQGEGYTVRGIAEKLGYKSGGTITKIIQRNKADDVSNQFPGNKPETQQKK